MNALMPPGCYQRAIRMQGIVADPGTGRHPTSPPGRRPSARRWLDRRPDPVNHRDIDQGPRPRRLGSDSPALAEDLRQYLDSSDYPGDLAATREMWSSEPSVL